VFHQVECEKEGDGKVIEGGFPKKKKKVKNVSAIDGFELKTLREWSPFVFAWTVKPIANPTPIL